MVGLDSFGSLSLYRDWFLLGGNALRRYDHTLPHVVQDIRTGSCHGPWSVEDFPTRWSVCSSQLSGSHRGLMWGRRRHVLRVSTISRYPTLCLANGRDSILCISCVINIVTLMVCSTTLCSCLLTFHRICEQGPHVRPHVSRNMTNSPALLLQRSRIRTEDLGQH